MQEIRNACSRMTIDWQRGRICSLESCGREVAATAELPVFSFRLRGISGEAVEYDAFGGELCALEDGPDGVRAEYAFGDLRAAVTVRTDGEDRQLWRMDVKNVGENAVEWLDFPQIPLLRERDGKKAKIYWPYNEGVQIDDIDVRAASGWCAEDPEYPGKGAHAIFPGMVESQFIAYELDGGVYLGAHDEKRGIKNIDYQPMEDAVRLKMRVYAGGEFGADYSMDYDIVLDRFEGGWMAAAEIYRGWLENHLPEGMKKITENPGLPDWYADAPVVATYPVRGLHDMDDMQPNRLFPYENALPLLDRWSEAMDSRLLVLLMHWEGTAPWAPPFVWPPYGGEEMFRAFADKLHARGHMLGVYLSGIGWTEQSNLIAEYNCKEKFEQGGYRRDVCIAPDGSLPYSNICTGQRRGYDLCPMGADTADIVCGEVRSMAAAGVDYAQILDQNHGGNPYFCYSREHGHAPTPGPWMTESMRALLDRAHETAPNMLFGCESAAGEPYIPRLLLSDNRFNLGWIYGKPVPMFAYLYHPYVNNFMGNQVCAGSTFAPDPESYPYRLAYSYTAGDLLTLIFTDDGRLMQAWGDRQFDILPNEQNVQTLLARMTALRRGAGRKYLHEGKMIAPKPVDGAGEREFELSRGRRLTAEKVLTSRWQAQDGTEAQVLVNWTTEPIECTVAGEKITVPALDVLLID